MCIEGQTHVFKTSESGREILLYQVGPGETCVLTTSCLMAGSSFPAESTAETDVLLAALPARAFHRLMGASPRFRKFVLDNYGDLLSSLIMLVDEVAFASLDLRLARRLLAEAKEQGVVAKTHQQLALDLGSVREVIRRYLAEWERMGRVQASRGSIEVRDRSALAGYGGKSPPGHESLISVRSVTWVTYGTIRLANNKQIGKPQTSKELQPWQTSSPLAGG